MRPICALTGKPCSPHCTVWSRPCEDADAEDWCDQGYSWVIGWIIVALLLGGAVMGILAALVPGYDIHGYG